MSISKYPYFYDLVRERYSCRHYDASAPVDDSIVKAILETAQLAPSACNRQPWTFVVVRDKATRQRLLHASRPSFVDAPVLIVACGHHEQAWHRPSDDKDHTDIDLAIAVEHICLAAAALDLGTCWVCSFDVEAVRAQRFDRLPDARARHAERTAHLLARNRRVAFFQQCQNILFRHKKTPCHMGKNLLYF